MDFETDKALCERRSDNKHLQKIRTFICIGSKTKVLKNFDCRKIVWWIRAPHAGNNGKLAFENLKMNMFD